MTHEPTSLSSTDQFLLATARKLDVQGYLDLGALVPDHQLIVRGLERLPSSFVLHYELAPVVSAQEVEGVRWHFRLAFAINGKADYQWVARGALDTEAEGLTSHGVRDIETGDTSIVSSLNLRFLPAPACAGKSREVDVAVDLANHTMAHLT